MLHAARRSDRVSVKLILAVLNGGEWDGDCDKKRERVILAGELAQGM